MDHQPDCRHGDTRRQRRPAGGLARVDTTGTLFAGGAGNNVGDLFAINPQTAAAALIGNTGFAITGLTLVGAVVDTPEPTTLLLMGLGLAGIGFGRRRKTPMAA